MAAGHFTNQVYGSGHSRIVRRMGVWGIVVNLLLSAVKCALGVIGSSQAMIADAVHSLSDSASDLAMIIGVRYWAAPADKRHPYGHARIETMISMFIGVGLIGVALGIVYNAVRSLHTADSTAPGVSVLCGALFAMLVKEGFYRWTVKLSRKADSRALLANAWHHRTDALSSLPVVVAAGGAWLWPSLVYLDQAAAIVVAVLVLRGAWKIARPAVRQLTDVGVTEEEMAEIRRLAGAVEGVHEVHGLRTRHIGPGIHVDLHILVTSDMTVKKGHQVASDVEQALLDRHPRVVDVLVHLEPCD